MTPEGLVSLPWYIWVLCAGVELLCRPEETPRQRNLGADRETVGVLWSAQDERGWAGHQQHLLQSRLCTSHTLCPVLGCSILSLFLQGHEEKAKEPTAEDWCTKVSLSAPIVCPKMFIHHLPSLPPFVEALPSQHFCGLGSLPGGATQFFSGYTDTSKSEVMMGFFCATLVVWWVW